MDYLYDYNKYVVEPIEKFKKKIIVKYSKSLFFKSYYKDLMDRIEDELIRRYYEYYHITTEEYDAKNIISWEMISCVNYIMI